MAYLLRFGERKNKFGVMQMMCCTDGEYVRFADIEELLQTSPNPQSTQSTGYECGVECPCACHRQ